MRITLQTVGEWAKKQAGLIAAVSVGVIIGATGSAMVIAAIPDASGVIHGCYSVGPNGRLKVIDSENGQTCGANETALNWSQTGPQGPAGPTGPTGPQGPQGPAGSGGIGGFVSDLTNADFSGASLQYRNFAGIDMHGSILTATLTGSDFTGANLSGSTFGSAKMADIKAAGVNFAGSSFGSVVSTGANFQNTNFTNTQIGFFNGGDFRGANITGMTINKNGGFSFADLSNLDFRPVTYSTSGSGVFRFNQSNLNNANFSGLTFVHGIDFSQTSLENADLSNVTLSSTINSSFANMSSAVGTDFSGSTLVLANFTGTDLSQANLTGVTWENSTCPDGTNSDSNGSTCLGHLVP